jgi:hypothetical protein
MKDTSIYSELFRLAVRLAGLFFLCIGLKDLVVQTFFVLAQARGTSAFNLLSNCLPVVFTLTVALWLLRGNWLVRMAYPVTNRFATPAPTPARQNEPDAGAVAPSQFNQMEKAEQKLAALVEKKQGLQV